MARTEADRVAAKVDKLASNDFPHLEKQLAEARADFGERFDGIESRLDRMDRRAAEGREAIVSRIMAALSKDPPDKP